MYGYKYKLTWNLQDRRRGQGSRFVKTLDDLINDFNLNCEEFDGTWKIYSESREIIFKGTLEAAVIEYIHQYDPVWNFNAEKNCDEME
jgi:hypothetical protein